MYPRRRWRRSVEWYIYHRLSIGGIQGLQDPRVISVGRRPALAGHYLRPRVCKVDSSFGFTFARATRIFESDTRRSRSSRYREILAIHLGSHPSRPPADRAIDFSARLYTRLRRFFILDVNLTAREGRFSEEGVSYTSVNVKKSAVREHVKFDSWKKHS